MTRIHSYLTFNGNCREAMTFYQQCLGGELVFQTIGDSPLSDNMPAAMKKNIVHSTLSRDGIMIIGSDMVPEKGLMKGNAVSLMLNCSSEEEIRNCYSKLAYGGEPTHPPHETFWGALFGNLTDKFGNQWLLHFDSRLQKKDKEPIHL